MAVRQYVDKSTGETVTLTESSSDFVARIPIGEAETLSAVLDQAVLSVTPSTNADGIVLLRTRSDTEGLSKITETLDRLRRSRQVLSVQPALVDDDGITRYAVPDQAVVEYAEPVPARQAGPALKRLGASAVTATRRRGIFTVTLAPGTDVFDFINAANAVPGVRYAEPLYYGFDDADINVTFQSTAEPPTAKPGGAPEAPNGPGQRPTGWNVTIVQAPAAWSTTTGDPKVIVVVVDGLPDMDHPALRDKYLCTRAEVPMFSTREDTSAHATNVCSIIAGESDRLTGLAPGVRILPVVVDLSSQSYVERAEALAKVAEIAQAGQFGSSAVSRVVLCCSWRTTGDVAVVRTALQGVVDAGVVAVVSAGNDGGPGAHYPSDYAARPPISAALLSVAATDQSDTKASYSNYSAKVSLCAPGGDGLPLDQRDVLCAGLSGSYEFNAGTSIAAPHVAAVAALMLSAAPELSAAEIKSALVTTADDIAARNGVYQGQLGSGRLNARKAVLAVAREDGEGVGPADGGSRVGPRVVFYDG